MLAYVSVFDSMSRLAPIADNATARSSATTSATPLSSLRRRLRFPEVRRVLIKAGMVMVVPSGQKCRNTRRHRLLAIGDADAGHGPDQKDVPGRYVQQRLGGLLVRLGELVLLLRTHAQGHGHAGHVRR